MSPSKLLVLVVAALIVAGTLEACAREAPGDRPEPTPLVVRAPRVPGQIEHALFAPERVLAQADRIDLTDAQRTRIVALATTAQASLTALDRELDTRTTALAETLAPSTIDEEAAVTAARAVIAVEDEIKIVHLRMLVQIRNALDAEQQAQLAAL